MIMAHSGMLRMTPSLHRGAVRCASSARPPHAAVRRDSVTFMLTVSQISTLLTSAAAYKRHFKAKAGSTAQRDDRGLGSRPLTGKTVGLLFSKLSTRTRVASETSVAALGGHPLFLGKNDIQLGTNETLYDSSRVIGSMVDGIMARVGDHSEVELLAETSGVPVVNALSSLYHPTQILADLLTLVEHHANPFVPPSLHCLHGLKVAWVGDSNNILNDMILAFPRLGIHLAIATPKGYELDASVMKLSDKLHDAEGGDGKIVHTNNPLEAVRNADVIVTDTWISMGQEEEKERRLRDFAGFQVTRKLAQEGGAKSTWKFMHCLPRKPEEVDDEVFYSDRSLVFPEAENRKWTIMAVFAAYFAA